MTTNNSILVDNVRSNKSDNMVWAVYAQGNEQQTCYCKSPYAAMKMAFLMKKQTGLYISDICLTRLSLEIRKLKEAALTPEQKEAKEKIDEAVEQFVEEHSVDNVLAKADEEKAKAASKQEQSELAQIAEQEQARTESKAKGKRKSSKPKASAKKKQKEEKEKVAY